MKNLLKDFTIQKVLRQLSASVIDRLLADKAQLSSANLAALRKDKKRKTNILEAITGIVRDNPDCIRLLRIAYFFHKNRSAFVGLHLYLANKNVPVDWNRVSAGKSEAEHTVILCLEHAEQVIDYFVISIHTHQGKAFCSCRNDYVDADIDIRPSEAALDQICKQLLEKLKDERGSRYCGPRSFEYDGKVFLMLEFDDLPSHQREFEEGKDKPEDKFRRLALDLVYVFDLKNKTVDAIAETPELRLQMHRVCASVVYGEQEIAARPPKNEVFDLEKLLGFVLDGKQITSTGTKTGVRQAFVNVVRLRRTRPPYWTMSLDISMPAKHMEEQKDWVKEIQDITKVINTKPEPGGWWHKSYVQATHAELAIVCWDEIEKKEISRKITVDSSGGTNLGHGDEDEKIKAFLREVKLFHESTGEDSGDQADIGDLDEKVA